jgi:hypothetical protein
VALLLVALSLLNHGRAWGAALVLALAGLAREASVLSVGILWPKNTQTAPRAIAQAILVFLPVTLWVGWLFLVLPRTGALGNNNFSWPLVSFARHCVICARRLAVGDWDSRYFMGLLGALSLAYQSLCILLRPRPENPWWRAALPFAVLLWVLGDSVWMGYWAASRALLPMTFAFNLMLKDEEKFWRRLTWANLPLVAHGVWRMLP